VFGRLLVEPVDLCRRSAHPEVAAGVTTWPSRIALGAGIAEGAPRARDPRDPAEPEVVMTSPLRRVLPRQRVDADPAHCDAVCNARRGGRAQRLPTRWPSCALIPRKATTQEMNMRRALLALVMTIGIAASAFAADVREMGRQRRDAEARSS
jgi:hypothetical protein